MRTPHSTPIWWKMFAGQLNSYRVIFCQMVTQPTVHCVGQKNLGFYFYVIKAYYDLKLFFT